MGLASLLATVVLSSPALAARGDVDWDTYGFSVARSGLNPYETVIGAGNVGHLRQAWSVDLGGVIDTQPLVAARVVVPNPRSRRSPLKDLVLAGTETGVLDAVDARTGRVVWRRSLGYVDYPRCSDLPHFGITGTPVVDRATDIVYAPDGKGRVDALALSTGRIVHRWTITTIPRHEHVWSALTLFHGRIYVEIAGDCDVAPYHGRVISIDPRSGAINRWFVTGRRGPSGGGIWSWAGISADARSGALYTATGNALASNEHVGYAEHVVRLTRDLRTSAANYPGLSGRDADFGATPVLYQASGCPPQLALGNKYGSFFVYDRDRVGQGPVQHIALGGNGSGQDGVLGAAAYWPAQRLLYVNNPEDSGAYAHGVLAFRVTASCQLSLAWQAPGPPALSSSPTLANGVLFYATGTDSRLIALDARTGKQLWTHGLGGFAFNAPSVANGAVYVGAWDGRLRAFRLR